MPSLTSALLLNTLANRNVTLDSTTSLVSNATNATNVDDVMQVVCAWPVSGQYGIGSRILYYFLVAACVIARKAEWLRNACLAAALVFPAVAAIHAIVLAALHVDGAIDMDVYGAFQFCSIGILAAPLTVRISRTYFYDPGRNIIFLWTGLVLAGGLPYSLLFELNTNRRKPISPTDYDIFPYEMASCNLTCSIEKGPSSPLRKDSTDEIYVIPAPHRLALNAVTLLAAACCIPAVLSLASMWNKILEINWKTKFGLDDGDQLIEGTNGATVARMSKVNTMVRLFLSTLEVPLFSAAVLAIIVFGELNFNSSQVKYQTEPITSIGQWAPIVGTGLAALGSLYVLLAGDLDAEKRGSNGKTLTHHCNCSHHHFNDGLHLRLHNQPQDSSLHSVCIENPTDNETPDNLERDSRRPLGPQGVSNGVSEGSSHFIAASTAAHFRSSSSNSRRDASMETTRTASRPTNDIGGRRKVARWLMVVSNYFGTASHDRFDDSEFRHGKALNFPEVPAEEQRNPDLPRIREAYNHHRNDDVYTTPAHSIRPSRSGSFTGSIRSGYGTEGSPTMTRATSAPHPRPPVSRSSSPSPSTRGLRHSNTLPCAESSCETQPAPSPSSSSAPIRGRPRERRDTLEVPVPTHPPSSRNAQPPSPPAQLTITGSQGSPVIVISPDPDTGSPTEDIPVLGPPVTQSHKSEPSSRGVEKSPP